MEVDQATVSKEVLTHGRAKVLLGKVCKLPVQILLVVSDFRFQS